MEELFPLFVARWRDPQWYEPLRLSIYWYLQANNLLSTETSLLVAQAALELLGWAVLVEGEGALSADGFDRLPASDKLRLLLRNASVSLAIPTVLVALTGLAEARAWEDGPRAIGELRNSLVHPKLGKRRLMIDSPVRARIEVTQLALSYIELALLHLLRYRGDYVDRLHAQSSGEVAPVPWKTPR
jgi:hypothetical protein